MNNSLILQNYIENGPELIKSNKAQKQFNENADLELSVATLFN